MNIAVVGTGLVGSAFLRQLSKIAPQYNLNVVLIGQLGATLISKNYSPLDISHIDFSKATEGTLSPSYIAEFLAKSPKPAVLVDITSNAQLAEAYPEFLRLGVSIVTPNKKAFSGTLELWKEIFDPKIKALVNHECTVGAALPVIGTLNDLVITGDKVRKIEGILSGTLSYIFNEFSASDEPFSEIVLKAKKLGYTEPDPREDLNGLDVARKATILSRLAGNLVASPSSFPVDTLIPKPLESVKSVDEFLEKLPEYDDDLSKLRAQAKKEGKVLRYVAKVDLEGTPSVNVGIEKYDLSHPFASLKGADNVVSILSERYPSPLIIQGAGAGAEVTAMGVLADLLKVAERGGKKLA